MNTKQVLFAGTIALLLSTIFATESPSESPSDSPSAPGWFQNGDDSFTFASVVVFITPNYDPDATAESVNNNQTIQDLCAKTDDPTQCLQFLGNTPEADPASVILSDIKILKALLSEGSYIAVQEGSKDPSVTSETKKSLDVCLENYDKANKSLDSASTACAECVKDDNGGDKAKKCPKETVKKLTAMLSAVVSNFGFCDEALNAASGNAKLWVMDANDAMADAANGVLAVAKTLDS
ncbi:unnamed protein product [Linum trigynum]|uniref:Pectinesterase inhibitor domain-containing protein n=1 Tax=Linum trigynum TaxID=586398 RepID=A0AAV2FQS4_9ROSI